MSLQQDLELIALQESRLQFTRFDANVAWELGARLKTEVEAMQAAVAIEIYLGGMQLFYYAMPGTTPDNAQWLRRKRNVVERFFRSSYAVGLGLQQRQTTLEERYGLPVCDYAAHGGCVPVRIQGVGVVGSIAISGLVQREDHGVVIDVIASYLGESREALRLPAE